MLNDHTKRVMNIMATTLGFSNHSQQVRPVTKNGAKKSINLFTCIMIAYCIIIERLRTTHMSELSQYSLKAGQFLKNPLKRNFNTKEATLFHSIITMSRKGEDKAT